MEGTFQVWKPKNRPAFVGKKAVEFLNLRLLLVAAGPLGRNAEASGTASIKSIAAVYSYSRTRGLFAGVSLEGSVILERFDANAKMYGRKVATRDLLNGTIPPPPQAEPLYRALSMRFNSYSAYDFYPASAASSRFSFMNSPNNGRSWDHNTFSPSSFDHNSRTLGRSGTMYNPAPVYGEVFEDGKGTFSRANIHNAAATAATAAGGAYGGGSSGGGSSYGGGYAGNYYSDSYPSPASPASLSARASPERPSEPRARALFNFAGEQEGDLPFRKGDIITILKRTETQHDW